MSAGKHTPEPWTAEEPDHKYAEEYEMFLRGANGKLILAAFAHRPTHADIRMIEAAPDLLAALESIENDCGCIPAEIWELRNRAIAKAKGETK